ncbi:MAG TPA: glycosyltransferase [Cellvibrio sp.]|nr:glycosyltransferase [Cellvibrio sp.]
MDISIIIPAYNEQNFIAKTLETIKKRIPGSLSYEIIVVDHGSSDHTVKIALDHGVKVLAGGDLKTIAGLRNKGAVEAGGEILIFIDADISLSPQWSEHIGDVISSLKVDPNTICGSHPKTPDTSNFFIKHWFDPKILETSPNYIFAGHLIITKDTFLKCGMFPEHQETAEEFTLCVNAKTQGTTIQAYPQLLVTHHGAPHTIIDFIKSEAWHGRSSWSSLRNIFNSKVSMLTLIFIGLHSSLPFLHSSIAHLVVVLFIIVECSTASYLKFSQHGIQHVVINIFTFYFYFVGRSLSLFSYFLNRDSKKRTRSLS